jgi:hypothetical protein
VSLFAGCSWLQEGELELSQDVPCLLRLGRERRNSPVRWIDDERGPAADGQVQREGRLGEFSVDVSLGAARPAAFGAVPADNIRNLLIELGAFCVREELPAREPGGALQGHVDISGPDALKVRFAPRRLRRWSRLHGDCRGFARRRGSLT